MGRRRQDKLSRRAKAEGYAARSVYKLEELDRRFRLLTRGARVLDLGCHPGSWLRYAATRVGPGGIVIGIDRVETEPPAPNVSTMVGDVLSIEPNAVDAEGTGFDVVLSDMAPDTTGIRMTDQARSAELTARALDLALALLRPGGHLVAKVFQGPDVQDLVRAARAGFADARTARASATRKESSEVYLVARSRSGSRPPTESP